MIGRFLPAGVCVAVASCASPLGGEDLELGAGVTGLPRVGGLVSFSQRMHTADWGRLDLEVDVSHQDLKEDEAENGHRDDDFGQVRLGMRWRLEPVDPRTLVLRLGIAWMRVQGDFEYLDEPADYGGGFVGIGYEFPLGDHAVTGPDFSLMLMDAEGTGDTGLVPQFAWRILWKL